MLIETFAHTHYTVRRKIFTLLGGAFHVYDPAGQVVMYSRLKAFKLREDIRVYTGRDMQREVLAIRARNIIDWSAAYDVVDSQSGEKVGAIRRRGFKSIIRDEWMLLDASDREIGSIREESTLKALLRRFVQGVALLLPQRYTVSVGGLPVASFRQNFNPFVYKLDVDLSSDERGVLDRRLALAAAILLAAIEGKQQE